MAVWNLVTLPVVVSVKTPIGIILVISAVDGNFFISGCGLLVLPWAPLTIGFTVPAPVPLTLVGLPTPPPAPFWGGVAGLKASFLFCANCSGEGFSISLPVSSKGKNLTLIPLLVGFLFTSKLTLYFLPSIVVLYLSISLCSVAVKAGYTGCKSTHYHS